MKSPSFPYNEYEHVKCETCGSVVGMYDNTNYTCSTCGQEYPLSYISNKANIYMPNTKTGWVFPMVKRKRK